jgi:hypothetical protein
MTVLNAMANMPVVPIEQPPQPQLSPLDDLENFNLTPAAAEPPAFSSRSLLLDSQAEHSSVTEVSRRIIKTTSPENGAESHSSLGKRLKSPLMNRKTHKPLPSPLQFHFNNE